MAENISFGLIKPAENEVYDVSIVNSNTQKIADELEKRSLATNLENIPNYINSVRTTNAGEISVNNGAIIGGQDNVLTYTGSISTQCGGIFASCESQVYGLRAVAIGGRDNQILGENSVGLGAGTYVGSTNNGCVAVGLYNQVPSSTDMFVLGAGTTGSNRLTCFRITNGGNVYAKSGFNSNSGDYAEYFEWKDGNPEIEDRVGLFVSHDAGKIRLSDENSIPFGIISASPAVCGNSFETNWNGRFKRDVFGRLEVDENGHLIESEEYDKDEEYIPRSQRSEWSPVGMIGQLIVIDDGTAKANDFLKSKAGGIGTVSITPTRFQVMERLDENHVKVLVI